MYEHYVAQNLNKAADLFEAKGDEYDSSQGEAYRQFGDVMAELFPDGYEIKDANDMSRIGVVTQIVSKVVRYCNNFNNGGHNDSLDDLTVYAQILKDLDNNG